MPIFIILFFVVPLVEIYLLIQVGQEIGALNTIGLCVLTALLGGALLRKEGLDTLRRAQANLDRRTLPALEMMEGVALVIGGALLMTPGFATDAIGFACLFPLTRRLLVQAVLSRMHVTYGPVGEGEEPAPERARRSADGRHNVIEGEYVRRDDDPPEQGR